MLGRECLALMQPNRIDERGFSDGFYNLRCTMTCCWVITVRIMFNKYYFKNRFFLKWPLLFVQVKNSVMGICLLQFLRSGNTKQGKGFKGLYHLLRYNRKLKLWRAGSKQQIQNAKLQKSIFKQQSILS